MIPKPVHEIGLPDLQALIGTVREGKTIEYKRRLPAKTRDEVVKFLAAVSSLANTAGGDLLIGIEADAGVPTAIPGIAPANIDDEKLRLEHLLAESIEPRLPRIEIEPVDCGNGQHVLVIRAHRSWLSPHRVTVNDKFYGRNSAGKYPLDVTELRTAFVLSESVADRIRNFRNDRLIRIAGRETSVLLHNGAAMVIHVVPFSTFAGSQAIDAVQSVINGHVIPIPPGRKGLGSTPVVNLDGFATVANETENKTLAYAQLFRSGAIEGVYLLARGDDGAPFLAATAFENVAVAAIRSYLLFLKSIDIGFPVYIFLSFSGMAGCYLHRRTEFPSSSGYYRSGPLRVDTIALPEVTIDSDSSDMPAALRPLFNTIWNAFGFPASDNYNQKGEWIGTG